MKYHGYCLLLMLVLLYLVWHKKYKETCIVLVGGGIVMFLLQQNVYEPYDNCLGDGIRDCGPRTVCEDSTVDGNCDPPNTTFPGNITPGTLEEPNSIFKDIPDIEFLKKVYLREQLANSKALMEMEGDNTRQRSLTRIDDNNSEIYNNIKEIIDKRPLITRLDDLDDAPYSLSSIGPFSLEEVFIIWNDHHTDPNFDAVDGYLETQFFSAYDNLVRYFEQECVFVKSRDAYDMEGLSGNTSYYNICKLYKSIESLSEIHGGILIPIVDGESITSSSFPPIHPDTDIQFALHVQMQSRFEAFQMLGECPPSSNDGLIISTFATKLQKHIAGAAGGNAADIRDKLRRAHSSSQFWGGLLNVYGDEMDRINAAPPRARDMSGPQKQRALKLLYHEQLLYNLYLSARKIEDTEFILYYTMLFEPTMRADLTNFETQIADNICTDYNARIAGRIEAQHHFGNAGLPNIWEGSCECTGTKVPHGQNCASPSADGTPITMETCEQRYAQYNAPNVSRRFPLGLFQCMWAPASAGRPGIVRAAGSCVFHTNHNLDGNWRGASVFDQRCRVTNPVSVIMRDHPEQLIDITDHVPSDNELTNLLEKYQDEKLEALKSLKYITDDSEWDQVVSWGLDLITQNACNAASDTLNLFDDGPQGEAIQIRCEQIRNTWLNVKKHYRKFQKIEAKVTQILKEESILREEADILRQVKLMKSYAGTAGAPTEGEMEVKLEAWISSENNTSSLTTTKRNHLSAIIRDDALIEEELNTVFTSMRGSRMTKLYESIGKISSRISSPITYIGTQMQEYRELLRSVDGVGHHMGKVYGKFLSRLPGGSSLFGNIGGKALKFLASDFFQGFVIAREVIDLALGDMDPVHAFAIGQGHINDAYVRIFNDEFGDGHHDLDADHPGVDPNTHPGGLSFQKQGTYHNVGDLEEGLKKISWSDSEFYVIKWIYMKAQLRSGMDMVTHGVCLQMEPDLCYRRGIRMNPLVDRDTCNRLQIEASLGTPVDYQSLHNDLIFPSAGGADLVSLSDNAGGEKVENPEDLRFWWVGPSMMSEIIGGAAMSLIDEMSSGGSWLFQTNDNCIDGGSTTNGWRGAASVKLNAYARECPTAKMYVGSGHIGPRMKTPLEKSLDEKGPDEHFFVEREVAGGATKIAHTFRGTGLCMPDSDCYNMRKLLERTETRTDPTSQILSVQRACSTMMCGTWDDNSVCNDNCLGFGCCSGTDRSEWSGNTAGQAADQRMYEHAEKVGYCEDANCGVLAGAMNSNLLSLNSSQINDPINNPPRYSAAELMEGDPNYATRYNKDLLVHPVGSCSTDQYERTDPDTGDVTCSDCSLLGHYRDTDDNGVVNCHEKTCSCSSGQAATGSSCDGLSSTDSRCCSVDGEEKCVSGSCRGDTYYLNQTCVAKLADRSPLSGNRPEMCHTGSARWCSTWDQGTEPYDCHYAYSGGQWVCGSG